MNLRKRRCHGKYGKNYHIIHFIYITSVQVLAASKHQSIASLLPTHEHLLRIDNDSAQLYTRCRDKCTCNVQWMQNYMEGYRVTHRSDLISSVLLSSAIATSPHYARPKSSKPVTSFGFESTSVFDGLPKPGITSLASLTSSRYVSHLLIAALI